MSSTAFDNNSAAPRRMLLGTIVLCLVTAAGYGTYTAWLTARSGMGPFEWPAYVGYFLAGHYIASGGGLSVAWRRAWGACAAVAVLLLVVVNAALYPLIGGERMAGMAFCYLHPLVVLMSIGVFAAVYRPAESSPAAPRMAARILTALTPYALGVYVMHPFLLRMFSRQGWDRAIPYPALGVPTLTVALCVSCLAATAILSQIPVVRRTVL
jgi:surface polysaccharide O-acyltransferase-like enzyme